MPAGAPSERPRKTLPVSCPECGHRQYEYPAAIAALCRNCGHYIPIRAKNHKRSTPAVRIRHQSGTTRREILCHHCHRPNNVPVDVTSWHCNHCDAVLDFTDTTIDRTFGTNFCTYGDFTLTSKGRFIGTRIEAHSMRLSGFSSGELHAHETVFIEGHTRLRAAMSGQHLEVQPGSILEATSSLRFHTVTLHGKVEAPSLIITHDLEISCTGELTTDTLRFGSLNVEPGGSLRTSDAQLVIPPPDDEDVSLSPPPEEEKTDSPAPDAAEKESGPVPAKAETASDDPGKESVGKKEEAAPPADKPDPAAPPPRPVIGATSRLKRRRPPIAHRYGANPPNPPNPPNDFPPQ